MLYNTRIVRALQFNGLAAVRIQPAPVYNYQAVQYNYSQVISLQAQHGASHNLLASIPHGYSPDPPD
jgi:hypothetical protein